MSSEQGLKLGLILLSTHGSTTAGGQNTEQARLAEVFAYGVRLREDVEGTV